MNLNLTNKRETYHVENATDTLKLNGEITIDANGLVTINGQVNTTTAPGKSLSFNYNEDAAGNVNRSCNGSADIQEAANAFVDATIAATKAEKAKEATV